MFDHPPVCLDVHKDMKQVWTIRTRLEINGPEWHVCGLQK